MTNMLIKRSAIVIREVAIEIGIANHFSNGDRDRDRDLNFSNRAHALLKSNLNLQILKRFLMGGFLKLLF